MPTPLVAAAASRLLGRHLRTVGAWTATGALIAAALILAPSARADHYLGSPLSVPATYAQAYQQDTTFWATAIPVTPPPGAISNPNRAVVPEDGQILQFQVRGFAGGGFGPQPVHLQDLRPIGGGRLRVISTSARFMLPATDGIWSFDPANFCVKAGDVLGFSDEGGFAVTPTGIPFQVFGQVPGATTQHYTANNGVKNGDTVTPSPLPPGTELLMAAFEGTGGHSSPLCGGIQGIELHPPSGSAKVGANGVVTLSIGCNGPLPCNGGVTLQVPTGQTSAKRKRKPSNVLASGHFQIPSHHTSKVKVRLTSKGRRLLRSHHGKMKVVVAVSAGAGGPSNTVTSTITLHG